MSEQTATVESSTATPVIEVDRGPLVTWSPDQRAEFRRTGEPPKIEESAPSKTEEAPKSSEATEAKTEGATESPKKLQEQNHRKPGAEQRIGQLTSENKRLKAELEALKTPKPAAEAAKPAQQQPPPQRLAEPTPEDKNADGTPKFKTYEEYTKALARWEIRQELAEQQAQQTLRAQQKEINAKVDEAKTRYENFDAVIEPALKAISDPSVSPVVKQMLNDSEVLPDLLFTIASDQKELVAFTKMAKENPGKALRYIALTESLIHEELTSKAKEKAPVKTQTSAVPRPPAEVGGRASAPPDALESAAKANDFRQFKSESNRRYLARLKG